MSLMISRNGLLFSWKGLIKWRCLDTGDKASGQVIGDARTLSPAAYTRPLVVLEAVLGLWRLLRFLSFVCLCKACFGPGRLAGTEGMASFFVFVRFATKFFWIWSWIVRGRRLD